MGLSTSTFTFSYTSTTGTDFNISTTTNTIIFNLPTASASNRGALSPNDWSTFNNKFTFASSTIWQTLCYITYSIQYRTGIISTDFSTSSINNFTSANTFNATTSVTELKAVNSAGSTYTTTQETSSSIWCRRGVGTSLFGGLNISGATTFTTASGTGITATDLYSTNNEQLELLPIQ